MFADEEIIAMLCRRIKLARIEKNWSQMELAKRSNLGIATIKRVEMGRAITLLTLIAILRGLDELDQLKNILVHKELKVNDRRQKFKRRKRRLIDNEKAFSEGDYCFIVNDDLSTMRWQTK